MITISAFKWVPDFARGSGARSACALGAGGSRPALDAQIGDFKDVA